MLERISQPRRIVGDHCRGIRAGTGQRPCPIYETAVSHAEQSSLFIELTHNFLYVNFKLSHYQGESYEIMASADGQEALEAIDYQRPDVIILDLLMPRMDGFMLIEQIQQTSHFRQIPIIVLTAKMLTAAERVRLEQRVRTLIQKRGLDREPLIQELRGLLQAYRGPTPNGGIFAG